MGSRILAGRYELLERIGEGAFNGCSSLMEVTMEGSVKEVANRAFSGTPYGNLQSKMR